MRIAELAERSGVSVRNLKRYIELGLINPPVGRTRAASYSQVHLQEVDEVQALLLKGLSLADIRRKRSGASERSSASHAVAVADLRVVTINTDVIVGFLDSGRTPASLQKEIIKKVAEVLQQNPKQVKTRTRKAA